MLIVVRREARPFEKNEQTLLEAVADYASISLINARLFRALNSAVQVAREAEKRQNALLEDCPAMVCPDVWHPHAPAGPRLAQHRRREKHADPGPNRLGQNDGRVPLGH